MKSHRFATLAAACCVFATAALAWRASAVAVQSAAQPTAVAVVDPTRVLDGLTERTDLEAQLTKDIESRRAQLQQLVDRMKALQVELQQTPADAPGYDDKRAEFAILRSQTQATNAAFESLLSLRRGEILKDMYQQIADAARQIAERRGYDIVLLNDSVFPLPNEAQDRDIERMILSRTVVYASDQIDITQDVVTLMNNAYRAAGGGAGQR